MCRLFLTILLSCALGVQAHDDAHQANPSTKPADAAGMVTEVVQDSDHKPSLEIELVPVADGFELHLITEHFVFASTPADVPSHLTNGHAHVYLDGKKIARAYSAVHKLPTLPAGVHDLMAELVSHEHAPYVIEGRPLRARLVTRVPPPDRAADQPRFADLEAIVVDGSSANKTLRATQGDTVRLQISVDEPLQLHLHGYDIEVEAIPALPLTVQFLADIAGRFPVAQHAQGAGHGHRALFYLEVYPE